MTLTGPRRNRKSPLCRAVFPDHPYFNLESPDLRAFAQQDPRGFLAQCPDGAVLDEIHRAPELPSHLQDRIDDDPRPRRWILTGSQNLSLLTSVSQSLAGRTAVLHLLPLAYSEVLLSSTAPVTLEQALLTGGYPRVYDSQLDPGEWLASYTANDLERDVRSITAVGDLHAFQRFLKLSAGRSSGLVNHPSLGADAGVSRPTARSWSSILEASFVTFRLPPMHLSLRKRLVKQPKLHFHDTGLLCWLLGIREPDQLRTHPLRGAIFETWVASETLEHRYNQGELRGLTFYRDSEGVEVDLVVETPERLTLIEAKSGATPSGSMFDGIRRARKHLEADPRDLNTMVVYGGESAQQREAGEILPWSSLHERRSMLL